MTARIDSFEVRVFETETRSTRDHHGHRHPGPLAAAHEALVTVRDSEGAEGHVLTPVRNVREDAFADPLLRGLVGRPVMSVEQVMRDVVMAQRGNPVDIADRRIAVVDELLWDLIGVRAGAPVWRLLGGAQERVRAYASTMCGDEIEGGLATPEDYARFARQLVEQGYRAIKLHTWFPPVAFAPSVKRDIEACAAVREAVGPDVDLMLDGYHWYNRQEALTIGRAIEELGFRWFEEPMEEVSITAYRWLSDQLDIPVIGPETASGRNLSRGDWAHFGAVDILRIGPQNGGGITSSMKALHMAESLGMTCEIHGNGAASLAVVAATYASQFYERGLLHPHSDYDWLPPHLSGQVDPLDDDGGVTLHERPGIGQQIDLDHIRRHTVRAYEVTA
ncbi:enolase C-terminal domain-like protein [Microbacterium sp. Marseille-Q6965]|uniref:enolase C-terminal domain-like protein n=1 Tax=Microbacterium sp. Marseille-Q6965 TaxID=2965072 RepID=UPI0021B765A9|nr:enolase C-terminal domain-like protein [Microbacterium sp. Marseille-Q6965]